jgi:tRNA A-37 threonylcarbamoyl transferase component Bud32
MSDQAFDTDAAGPAASPQTPKSASAPAAPSSGSDQPTIDHVPGSAETLVDAAGATTPRDDSATRADRPSDSGGGRSDAEPAPGRRIGVYEILSELARGGMGVVYQARHTTLGRQVALKMIRAGELAGRGEVERFQVEAEAAARLDHPNIVPIYEVGEHAGRPFFSMRLVEGGSLAQALPRLRDDPRAVARILAEVARAVHYAHQRGILHRDLKPANILLDADGRPQVSDFGLARRVEADSRLTQSGAVMGTPAYIPPEQASGTRGVVSTASDVYSLGAILYEALTGRPPFQADAIGDVLVQVLEREPERPTAIDPKADRDLETIALKCLEKDAARRYGSAEALADDLERWLRGEPIAARPATRWERAVKWSRRRPAVVGLLAGLVVVSLVSGAAVVGSLREAWRQADRARDEARRASEQTQIAQAQTALAREEARKRAEAEQVAQVGLRALDSLARQTRRAREVVGGLWASGNLETIGEALGRYHARHDRFPPAAIVDAQGRPLLSWRVALLPFLGHEALHARFKLDEPWDSPHNRALLPEMPSVYRALPIGSGGFSLAQAVRAGRVVDPTAPSLLTRMPYLVNMIGANAPERSERTQTRFRAIAGPGTMFDGPKGLPRQEADDGPEQTLLVVEADEPVPWTAPEEITLDPGRAPPRLVRSDDPDGVPVLFADGAVRRLPSDLSPETLRRLATRAGDKLPRDAVP